MIFTTRKSLKKRNAKKTACVVSVILTAALLFSLVPMRAYAIEELQEYSGDYKIQKFYDVFDYVFMDKMVLTGDCTIIKYNGSATNLTLPSRLNGYRVTNISKDAFAYNSSLKTIRLPETMLVIESYAFYQCLNLQKVYLPASVGHIDFFAFSCCDSLTHIYVDDDNEFFSDLDGILVCNYNTYDTSVKDNLLVCCPAGRSGKVTIPEGIRSVEELCFFGCSKINTIVLPQTIEYFGTHAFSACDSLKNINIPKLIKELPKESFSYCTSLESITIPGNVETIGEDAFAYCSSLRNVNLSAGLKKIGSRAFAECTALEGISIPEGVTSISDGAFHNDLALSYVEIPDSVTSLYGNPFSYDGGDVIPGLTVLCTSGSAAERYCKWKNIDYYLTDVKSDSVQRIAGSDRIDTALRISREGWDIASAVILTNGFSFPDALAGVPLSKAVDAPILLTAGKKLESSVSSEIDRLGATKVYILGGASAVSESVERSLVDSGYEVCRLSGHDRYETAVAIAEELAARTQLNPSVVYFASAANFPDALALSTVAAIEGNPVLYLPKTGSIDPATAAFVSGTSCSEAVIAGGSGAISDEGVESVRRLGLSCSRIWGSSRYETAMAICQQYSSRFASQTAVVATGENFPDALAGGALAAKNGSPLVLVSEASAKSVRRYLTLINNNKICVLGGRNAVSDIVVYKLEGNL